MVSGRSGQQFTEYRRTHGIPVLSPDAVSLVNDEGLCERAAKAFDRISHADVLLADHKRLHAVLVVRLGDVFVVEEARQRGAVWEVAFFDQNWKHLGFGYGAGH